MLILEKWTALFKTGLAKIVELSGVSFIKAFYGKFTRNGMLANKPTLAKNNHAGRVSLIWSVFLWSFEKINNQNAVIFLMRNQNFPIADQLKREYTFIKDVLLNFSSIGFSMQNTAITSLSISFFIHQHCPGAVECSFDHFNIYYLSNRELHCCFQHFLCFIGVRRKFKSEGFIL